LTFYIVLRRDHDAADRLARRPVRHQINFSDLGHRLHARLDAVRRRREPRRTRSLSGIAGCGWAGLVPLSQATLLQINPPERHGHAMAVFGIGTILGPIMGPALGGWLTYDYSWRWVFYINVPVGVLCTLGTLVFIRQTRHVRREPFDFVGFLTLSLGIGALQLMLDRGELKDWFHSTEIWIEATVAGLGFYLFTVHTVTTEERSFLNRDLLKSANFVAGTLLMFCGGLIMTGTLALLPTMLQNLMNYPALTTGLVTMPRGIGSMAAMFLVAPLINRVDNRLLILFGLLLTSATSPPARDRQRRSPAAIRDGILPFSPSTVLPDDTADGLRSPSL